MKREVLIVVGGVSLLLIGMATGYLLFRDSLSGKEAKQVEHRENRSEEKTPLTIEEEMPAEAETGEGKMVDQLDAELAQMFQVDQRGNLVLNQLTRLNVEKLHAINTPQELNAKLQRLSQILPKTAYRQLVRLVDDYDKYIREVQHTQSGSKELTTVEEAVEELERLHALRVKYFGRNVAESLYGEEERMTRHIFELMALEADENMTLQEKADKALMLIQSDPELLKVYDSQRDSENKHDAESTPSSQ